MGNNLEQAAEQHDYSLKDDQPPNVPRKTHQKRKPYH